MSAEDFNLRGFFSSAFDGFAQQSFKVADTFDDQLGKVSDTLRGILLSTTWCPKFLKPKSPPKPKESPIPENSNSSYIYIYSWIWRNKMLTAVAMLTLGGLTIYTIRRKFQHKKRRAKGARDGSRLEVVVIAGHPGEPLTRTISMDLERRGFIVYIVCSTIDEERLLQKESRPDIKPLLLDIKNPLDAKTSIERFAKHLLSPHSSFPGAKTHHLTLRSLIVVPPTNFPTIPIATLTLSNLTDLLNTRLIQPIITIQHFLPLLQNLSCAGSKLPADLSPNIKPSILLLMPVIISSINPAFHLPEACIMSALSSFASVLEQEVAPLDIPVMHLQLGTFDLSAFFPHNRQLTIQSQRAETLRWDEEIRNSYGRNYAVSTTAKWSFESNLRVLNKAVVNAMYSQHGGVVKVGSGSTIYGFVGKWVPRSMIAWMSGMKSVDRAVAQRALPTTTDIKTKDDEIKEEKSDTGYMYDGKSEEAFADAAVWTLGFGSSSSADELGS
ncbi:hypothetical protein BGHDH14_bgh05366 [Blumeria hordei DH14]|uniref:DUF1776-domain-containing protein n=1 Tax=Blumeria graminis f. sp. hordei (strain DH14) TaxID=546991 RepID=N1JHY2_BLUG1|nr:hypothetical protein BGHDH14_bgh05366 [Blumeria hordei DH14]